jgi:hypothetical protein
MSLSEKVVEKCVEKFEENEEI